MYQKVAYANGDGVDLVTSLPASPHDGQEIIFTDSTTTGTYHWRLRYVSGRSTNKWVFVGGAPSVSAQSGNSTDSQTATNTWQVLANSPQLTVPLAGKYRVELSATLENTNVGTATAYLGISVNAATSSPGAEARQTYYQLENATLYVMEVMDLSASDTVDHLTKVEGSGTWGGGHRNTLIYPIAVGG